VLEGDPAGWPLDSGQEAETTETRNPDSKRPRENFWGRFFLAKVLLFGRENAGLIPSS
jgi:hypothetical protein